MRSPDTGGCTVLLRSRNCGALAIPSFSQAETMYSAQQSSRRKLGIACIHIRSAFVTWFLMSVDNIHGDNATRTPTRGTQLLDARAFHAERVINVISRDLASSRFEGLFFQRPWWPGLYMHTCVCTKPPFEVKMLFRLWVTLQGPECVRMRISTLRMNTLWTNMLMDSFTEWYRKK